MCQTIFRVPAVREKPSAPPAGTRSQIPSGGKAVDPAATFVTPYAAAPKSIPGYTRCNFCHEYIPAAQAWNHRNSHVGTQADGQQVSYLTLPPEQRFLGSLEGVPNTYVHAACGGTTTVSEDIIRTYLMDPYFYAYRTYCSGCGNHVRHSELTWTETGESLTNYYRRLKQECPNAAQKRRNAIMSLFKTAGVGCIFIGLLGSVIAFFVGGLFGVFVAWILTAVFALPILIGLLIWMRGGV